MNWKFWSLEEWNDFLVHIYFNQNDESSDAIHQFDASPSFLAKVLGVSSEKGHEAQVIFVAQFQRSLHELKQLFDASQATRGWTEESIKLPFFAQLYLSLIVASATEETQSEGNFRARLSMLLEQDIPQSYVNCLPRLWEATRDWSIYKSRSDMGGKILVLPDPRHETIIGYSKRLAFPGYRDQTYLAQTLTDNDLSSESPINQLVDAIGRTRNRFSPDFREEFEHFVQERGRDPNDARISETPFWRAVESVTWQSSSIFSPKVDYSLRLELSLTSDEDVVVQAVANKSYVNALDGGWQTSSSFDDENLYIEHGDDQADNQSAIAAILEDQSTKLLKPINRKPLSRQITQGCVVFTREDTFTWVNTIAMPPDGEICLLLRSDLARTAIEVFQNYRGSSLRNRSIAGVSDWSCIGPFIAGKANILTGLLQFKQLEALQRTIPTSHVQLIGGLRLPDGMLFLRPVVPTIKAAGSDLVNYVTTGGSVGRLSRKGSEEHEEYQFSSDQLQEVPIPSRLRLDAYADRRLIRTKSVDLVGRCSINLYKIPSNASHWLKEGATGQLVGWGDISTVLEGNLYLSAEESDRISRGIAKTPAKFDSSLNAIQVKWVPQNNLPMEWSDMFECLAALMTQKSSVGWSQVRELVIAGLGISNKKDSSVYVESLVQNGFIQRLFNRRWRGVRFLGVQPEQHIIDGPGTNEKRIIGLLSSFQREALRNFASTRGAKVEIAEFASLKSEIFGVTRLVGDDLDGLSQAIDINGVKRKDMWIPINNLPSPIEVLTRTSIRSSARSDSAESKWWDIYKHGFYLDSWPKSNRYALRFQPFSNQISSYSLFDSDKLIWQTEDRSWAIFLMERLATAPGAASLDQKTLISMNPLPLGLSHFIIQHGAGVVGVEEYENSHLWSYSLEDVIKMGSWLFKWGLSSEAEKSSPAMRHWMKGYRGSHRQNSVKGSRAFSKRYL